MKPKAQVVGLKTLKIKSTNISTPVRPHKKRVFTEDEWAFLNTLSNEDLEHRIGRGYQLIGLLHRPEMMNMTPKQAAKVSSNLRYQIDAIYSIIKARPKTERNTDAEILSIIRSKNNGRR